jgi:nucleoid-associated protein YgaU|tara:strand:- start:25610 stop:26263 length:654 start_codon:yes stop_codon:yes gene_type:complete
MKVKELLKIVAVTVFTAGFAVGCASSGSKTTEPTEAVAEVKECEGASPEAKNAIYAAKLKNARARNLGFDSAENVKLIKAAEQAAADCNDVRAMNLAKRAETEAETFIAKFHADQKVEAVVSSDKVVSLGNYSVQSGDNLWNIAGQDAVYGNPYQWPLIYKANMGEIKDADLIFPGQSFNIPTARAGDSAAAIAHAKNRGAWTIGQTEASDLDYLAQ